MALNSIHYSFTVTYLLKLSRFSNIWFMISFFFWLTVIHFSFFNVFFVCTNADLPHWHQMMFQDPATTIMEGIIDFHHDLMAIVVFISVFVFYLLFRLVHFHHSARLRRFPQYSFRHHTLLEVFWTMLPTFILYLIALPSFSLLYAADDLVNPLLTLRAIGNQWYWHYEYGDPSYRRPFEFDSYMVPDGEFLRVGIDFVTRECAFRPIYKNAGAYFGPRLLTTDHPVYVPTTVRIRLLTTSEDVIHSWAIPSLGIKLDACPGRLNQTSFYLLRDGVFYGQCSEICGINHAFMPIEMRAMREPFWLYMTDDEYPEENMELVHDHDQRAWCRKYGNALAPQSEGSLEVYYWYLKIRRFYRESGMVHPYLDPLVREMANEFVCNFPRGKNVSSHFALPVIFLPYPTKPAWYSLEPGGIGYFEDNTYASIEGHNYQDEGD